MVSGQAGCDSITGESIRSRNQASASIVQLTPQYSLVMDALSKATRAEALRRDTSAAGNRIPSRPQPVVQSLQGGDIGRRTVAEALAMLIRREPPASWVNQGLIAADLYDAWLREGAIPDGPVLDLLADPGEPVSTKARAVLALRADFGTDRFHRAALSALCSLAGRAAGLKGMLNDKGQADIADILDRDEFNLLSLLKMAILDGEQSHRGIWRPFQMHLPLGNPVTVELQDVSSPP